MTVVVDVLENRTERLSDRNRSSRVSCLKGLVKKDSNRNRNGKVFRFYYATEEVEGKNKGEDERNPLNDFVVNKER